ncbi:MAG: hypothetical protein IPK03_06315 [Bacteroidetes bacterium]|nr:hypothetical protein [Bacteroidota bacterium]
MTFNFDNFFVESGGGPFTYGSEGGYFALSIFLKPPCSFNSSVVIPSSGIFLEEHNRNFDSFCVNNQAPLHPTYLSGGWTYARNYTINYNSPTIKLIPDFNNQDGREKSVSYTFRVQNSSSNLTNNNWIYVKIPLGSSMTISQVQLLVGGVPSGAPLTTTGGLYRIGGIAGNTNKEYKITLNWKSCSKDSFIVYTGWDCILYPGTIADINCISDSMVLYLNPQLPEFESSFLQQPLPNSLNLCDTASYVIRVRNAGGSRVDNVRNTLTLAPGLSIIPGTTFYAFPDTTKWLVTTPSISGPIVDWNISNANIYINTQLLPSNSQLDSNSYYLKFKVLSSCNGFVSGKKSLFKTSGTAICGKSISSEKKSSQPYKLKNITEPYFSSIIPESFSPIKFCDTGTTLTYRFQNLGLDTLGANDSLSITLPSVLKYINNSTKNIANLSQLNPIISNYGGQEVLTWKLKTGLIPGDTIKFSFKVNSNPNLTANCDSLDILSETSARAAAMCSRDSSVCFIKILTGDNSSKFPVQKSVIELSNFKTTLYAHSSNIDSIATSLYLVNKGNRITSGDTLNINYYYDADVNGAKSIGDVLLFTRKWTGGIYSNDSILLNWNALLNSTQSCPIIAVIEDVNNYCTCNFPTASSGFIQLKNAGKDTIVCSNRLFNLGVAANAGTNFYTWTPNANLFSPYTSTTTGAMINTIGSDNVQDFVLTTQHGFCLSRDTAVVTIKSSSISTINQSICSNQFYLFNGVNRNTTGIYYDTLVSANSCDSLISLNLTVKPISNGSFTKTICSNQSYLFNGILRNTAGIYKDTLIAANGCDSILSLQLIVQPVSNKNLNQSICFGQNYFFNGINRDTTGTYYDTLNNYLGCDSILTLNLTVKDTSHSQFTKNICNNDTYLFNGVIRNTTGIYLDTLTNAAGCDSFITLNLIIQPISTGDLYKTICSNQSFLFNGVLRTTAGNYKDTLINALNCDSILTLHLTVENATSGSFNQAICSNQSILFNGININTAGNYEDTILNVYGCDSFLTMKLTVLPHKYPSNFPHYLFQ